MHWTEEEEEEAPELPLSGVGSKLAGIVPYPLSAFLDFPGRTFLLWFLLSDEDGDEPELAGVASILTGIAE